MECRSICIINVDNNRILHCYISNYDEFNPKRNIDSHSMLFTKYIHYWLK